MQELEKSEGTRKWKLEVQKKDLKQAQETISDARDNVKIAQADFERSSKELPKGNVSHETKSPFLDWIQDGMG